MGPIRDEDEAKQTACPYKFGLMPGIDPQCLGSKCAAWTAIRTSKTIATGIDPGEGWTKGSTTGVGGAVTQRTEWFNYNRGGCARMG